MLHEIKQTRYALRDPDISNWAFITNIDLFFKMYFRINLFWYVQISKLIIFLDLLQDFLKYAYFFSDFYEILTALVYVFIEKIIFSFFLFIYIFLKLFVLHFEIKWWEPPYYWCLGATKAPHPLLQKPVATTCKFANLWLFKKRSFFLFFSNKTGPIVFDWSFCTFLNSIKNWK